MSLPLFIMTLGWRLADVKSKAVAVGGHDRRGLLVRGIVAAGMTGVFKWAWMDYNLVTSSSVLGQEETYFASLLVCLPLIGLGLCSVRPGSVMTGRAGGITPELEGALTDNVPIVSAASQRCRCWMRPIWWCSSPSRGG